MRGQRNPVGNPRLIVVFNKMGAGAKELRAFGEQVSLNPGSVQCNQPIIQFLIVGVIESQRLESPFQTPISLSQEKEFRVALLYSRDCISPEFLDWRGRRRWKMLPGFCKHII